MNTWTNILAAFNDIVRDRSDRFFSAAQKLRFANRALREICEHCEYTEEYEDINTVAGTATYEVTADAYRVLRVEYDGQAITPILTDDLMALDAKYATRTGTPKFYYLGGMTGSQDAITVGLSDVPSVSVENGLRVWYSAYPTEIVAGTGEIEIPDWSVSAVLFYMLHLAYLTSGVRKNLKTSEFFRMLYEEVLDALARRRNSRLPKKWKGGEDPRITVASLSQLPDHIQEGPDAPYELGEGLARATSITLTSAEVALGTEFYLFWDEVPDAAYYTVWRGTTSSHLLEIERLNPAFQSEIDGYTDDTATTVGTYFYAVYATDENGYLGEQSRLFALTVTA